MTHWLLVAHTQEPAAPNPNFVRAGLLKLSNIVVALMRLPAVQRRLQSELEALPRQWVSYEELLAFFVDYGSRTATELVMGGGCTRAGAEEAILAIRLAAELLPQLVPDNPRLRYRAATKAGVYAESNPGLVTDITPAGRCPYPMNLPAVFEVARQQGSDSTLPSAATSLRSRPTTGWPSRRCSRGCRRPAPCWAGYGRQRRRTCAARSSCPSSGPASWTT